MKLEMGDVNKGKDDTMIILQMKRDSKSNIDTTGAYIYKLYLSQLHYLRGDRSDFRTCRNPQEWPVGMCKLLYMAHAASSMCHLCVKLTVHMMEN